MKHIVVCILLVALTGIIPVRASAAFRYSYVGNTGGNIGDQTPPAGSYTSETRITLSFELSSRLAPSLPPTQIGGNVLNYSISDGRTTLRNANSNIDSFRVGTDALGDPIDWVIDISTDRPSPVALGDQDYAISTRFNSDAANINECVAISSDTGYCSNLDIDTYRLAFNPGDWTVTQLSHDETATFEYAAKIICGVQEDPNNMGLSRGLYATAINIRNIGRKKITFRKSLALTMPPGRQRPGKIIPIAEDTLDGGEALEVDCNDVLKRVFDGKFPTPYIKGFIVLQSPVQLDVTAVYTVGGLEKEKYSSVYDIDVETILERRIPGDGK